MAGESASSVQPGGRQPAPGELALVQAFINSHFDLEVSHGAELFATPKRLGGWLCRHGLLDAGEDVSEADLIRALELREGLRRLAAGHATELEHGGPVDVHISADGPRYTRTESSGVSGALGLIVAITAQAMIEGSWTRLKVCPGEHCGWAFYDHSRNQSGRWCSMAVCGGRAKAKAHYRRRR
jgi:hypothetical protein